ncbi:MAG: TIM44-like domain-containing protein [Myxococcales bacterium]|jgi:uncharacterized membrane protein YebE (DUF533 family)
MPLRRLLPIALVSLLLGLSAAACGRVGDGRGSSGDGSRSSAFYADSSSSFGLGSLRLSSRKSLAENCRSLCLLLTLTLVFGLVKRAIDGRANWSTSRHIHELSRQRLTARLQRSEKIEEALARIADRDPGFGRDAFLRHVEKAFAEIQLAQSTGDFRVARRFMSDGVLERFNVELALDKLRGWRGATCGARLLDKTIVGVESDDELDTVHVELRAARGPESTFTEYWSFVRSTAAGTGKRASKLAEGKCPACGAPLAQAPNPTCESCGAILNSGAFDWVLSGIAQVGELRGIGAPTSGFARLKALDPAISRQALEDRASVVFWKWIEALATGAPKRFARHCAPQSFAHLQGIEGKPSDGHSQAALGSVELIFVDSDAEYDRAWFLLRWSTAGASTDIVRTSVMQLARRAGLMTNPKAGFATDRCHGCAAFLNGLDAGECVHCGAVLSQNWAFLEMVSPEEFELQRKAARQQEITGLAERIGGIADPWERRRALTLMVAAARADGFVSMREQSLLRTCAKRWEIDQAQLKALLGAPLDQLADVRPKSADEARVLFRALVVAALVDGRIDGKEKDLLESTGRHLKLQATETAAIVNELSRAARPPA